MPRQYISTDLMTDAPAPLIDSLKEAQHPSLDGQAAELSRLRDLDETTHTELLESRARVQSMLSYLYQSRDALNDNISRLEDVEHRLTKAIDVIAAPGDTVAAPRLV